MATITSTGIQPLDLSGYKSLFEERFIEAFGPDMALDAETPQGQIISIMALSAAEMDESLVSVSNGHSLQHSAGRQIDDLGTLLSINRLPSEKSTVSAIIAGVAGTFIQSGFLARTAAGDEFQTINDGVLPGIGSALFVLTAVNDGAIEAPAGALSQLVSLVPGVETILNENAASIGTTIENDLRYRSRYRLSTARLGVSTDNALLSALIGADAILARVEENFTDDPVTRQGLDIAAHSVMCLVLGGHDIAEAILSAKGLGVGMSGDTEESGAVWQSVTEIPVKITLAITALTGFPATALTNINDNLTAYVTETLSIGDGIDISRLATPINSVQGHRIESLVVSDLDDVDLPTETLLNTIYTLASDNIEITVS